MQTPIEKALEIIGSSEEIFELPEDKDIKPIKRKILAAMRESQDKLRENHIEDDSVCFKERDRIERASKILQDQLPREVIRLYSKDLNKIDSEKKLLELLEYAISCKDIEFLKKLLSEFKSGEGEEFGDYINGGSYTPLERAYEGGCPEVVALLLKHKADPKLLSMKPMEISTNNRLTKEVNTFYNAFFYSTTDSTNTKEDEIEFKKQLRVILNDRYSDSGTEKDYIKIKKLLLQYGTDRDEIVKTFNYNATDLIKGPFLPWGGNNEIKRTVIRYGAVDSNYTLFNIASAGICSLLTVRFAMLGASSSSWLFIPAAAFIIPASISICNVLISFAGYVSPTEPSPKFIEVKVESGKVTGLEQV